MPACVVLRDGEVLVGNDLLVRDWSDPESQNLLDRLPFNAFAVRGELMIEEAGRPQGEGLVFSSEELYWMLLSTLKNTAEDIWGQKITAAVVTVPASYGDGQQKAIKDAGWAVGLEILRTFKEHHAAEVAYKIEKYDDERLVLVYDIGASRADATVFEVGARVYTPLGTASSAYSGTRFTDTVAKRLWRLFQQGNRIEDHDPVRTFGRLSGAAEQVKTTLHSSSVLVWGLFREMVRGRQNTPWRNAQIFRTATDDQNDMVIRIFEGASFKTEHNIYLGEMVLPDLPPGPGGSVEVDVRFEAYKREERYNGMNRFHDAERRWTEARSEWSYWRKHLRPVLYYIGLDDDVVSGTEGVVPPQHDEDERAWIASKVSVSIDDTEWVEVAPDESG
ncbi:ATPase with role in protein import into the ER [Pestalotiopsis sp. 9143b]|nr:ATPase with role in protein import into the ER [Pestalotiopsis sp. 9143b]